MGDLKREREGREQSLSVEPQQPIQRSAKVTIESHLQMRRNRPTPERKVERPAARGRRIRRLVWRWRNRLMRLALALRGTAMTAKSSIQAAQCRCPTNYEDWRSCHFA